MSHSSRSTKNFAQYPGSLQCKKREGFLLLTSQDGMLGKSHLFFGFQEPRGHFPGLLNAVPGEG